ncbi:MAG: Fic family protein [Acidobacteriota bacterium]|nr:Fic family protein [Acidobacteriota bacterium]
MPSLDPDYLERLRFRTTELGSIHRLGEARGRQDLFVRQFPEQLETLRTHALIESAESSNRIEGVVAGPGRVADLVIKRTEPRSRSEQEIAGYRDALQLIHQTHAHIPVSPNVLLQFHQMLYRYHPGTGGHWKATDNQIIERDPRGRVVRVRFEPTAAVHTPQAMADLTSGFAQAIAGGLADPLVLTPLAILDFLCIHPFTDGNGRVARLLSLLLLYRFNYRVGRYISIERIVEESRETYYEALEHSSRGWHENVHDAAPWLTYFWGVLIRAYGEFETRVQSLQGSKTTQVRTAVLRRRGPFSMSEVEHDCPGVSRDMVRHVLRQMRAEGMVKVEGRGRGARWRAPR